ncbi:MAG: hypothetical protein H6977_09675 [Gammaproteobacteria bacterium]|nr:hypothetical protein [Gammaproteobacteria bacterium]
MWRHVVFLVTLSVAALALSVLLVPRGQELALMYYKAKRYRDALSGFEREFLAHGARPTVVVPLNKLYLQQGEVEAAVEAMDRTLAERPDDLEAYDLALEVYRDTMQPARYRAALARRVELVPSTALVRELASLYAFAGDRDGEAGALARLVERGDADDAETLRLARLLWVDGDVDGAVAALDSWRGRAGGRPDANASLFALDVYAAAGHADAMAHVARRWVEAADDADGFMQALAALVARQQAAAAGPTLRMVLAQRPGRADLLAPALALGAVLGEPAIFSDYVATLDADTGLRALRQGGRAVPPLSPRALALLHTLRDEGRLAALVGGGLAVALVEAGDATLARLAAPVLVDAPALAAPLRAAEFRLLAGDVAGARAAYAAIDTAPPATRLRRLNLALALGDPTTVAALLADAAWPAADYPALAWVYHDLGQAARGYARLGPALVARDDGPAQAAWALLAAGAGERDAVRAWLRASAPAAPAASVDALLCELGLVALAADDEGLAQAVAARAGARLPVRDLEAQRLVHAAGRFEQAVALTAPRVAHDATSRQLFQDALFALLRQRRTVREGLAGLAAGFDHLVAATLAAGDAGSVQARTLAYDLIDAGAWPQAETLLATLVERDPVQWYDAFRDASLASDEREAFFAFVAPRLAAGPADPLHDNYVYDLGRLGGGELLLPALASSVADRGGEPAAREAAYYQWRDLALQQHDADWVAVRLAAWLDAAAPGDALAATWRFDLAELGGPARALPYLEAAAAQGGAAARREAFYAFEAAADQAGAAARVVEFVAARLRAGETDAGLAALYRDALLASPARDAVGPVLDELVAANPARWGEHYVDWLAAGGDSSGLLAFARVHAGDAHLPGSLRRLLATRLLEAGDKAGAVAIHLALAADEAPGGESVDTLLWLWGPRPPPAALDWLAARAAASSGRTRAAWAALLAELGAPRRAAELLAAAARGAQPEPLVVERYARALLDAGARGELEAFLAAYVARAPRRAMLHWAARTASEADLVRVAQRAWLALLEIVPDDPRALREVGLAAFDAGRRGDAEQYLERYLARIDDDYEAHFFYAEALEERGFHNRAEPHYERILALLATSADPGFRARVVRAQTLHRLGHEEAALAAFEALLDERPGEGHLRADYVTMLLDAERLGRARQVLAERGGS